MRPLLHVRKQVLGITQQEMASLTGATQATVSRWEQGELEPDRDQLERIRDEAKRQGKDWDDSWFFDVPPKPDDQRSAA